MKRRALLASLASASLLAANPFTARAQPAQRVYRVGLVGRPLLNYSPHARADLATPNQIIEEGLRALGWVEGRNIQLIWKSAEGRYDRIPGIIDEFLRIPVDVLVVFSRPSVEVAARKTRTVPIVTVGPGLHEMGLAPSLARPGRNITGISLEDLNLVAGKMIQLLKSAAPRVTRIAFVRSKESGVEFPEAIRRAASASGVALASAAYVDEGDFERVIVEAARAGANGLAVWGTPATNLPHVQATIHRLSASLRLPAIHMFLPAAESGGLMAYGPDFVVLIRRVPYFIDKILRGTKPADLPIEQPDNYRLYLNLKAARELGLTIPHSLLVQADRVIE